MPRIARSVTAPPRPGVMFFWHGRRFTFSLDRWTLAGLIVGVASLSTVLVGAAAYLLCHDQLLAAMMARQAEMQYSYEDRIAALSTQMDQQTISSNAERGAFDTRLRRLAEKSEWLDGRAAAIDGVVARLLTGGGKQTVLSSTGVQPDGHERPLEFSGGLRLGHDGVPAEQHVETSSDKTTVGGIERAFDRLEQRQAEALGDLTGPTLRSVEQLNEALARTGLPVARWHLGREIGGPFVALAPTTIGFDETIVLLRDAAEQRERIGAIVNSVPLRRPLAGPLEVTSTFGPRLDPFFGRPAMHTGLDLHNASGEPVTATAAGVVTLAGSDGGYGNMVEIDHGNGVKTRYAHLGGISVTLSQKVAAGTIIGQVGSTGRATGPHLHYEVRVDGEPVDPARFLMAGADLFPG